MQRLQIEALETACLSEPAVYPNYIDVKRHFYFAVGASVTL